MDTFHIHVRCIDDSKYTHQMGCAVTTMVIMMKIAIRVLVVIIHQINGGGIMAHHRLGMGIPGESQSRY